MKYYTFWRYDMNKSDDDAILLEEEPTLYTKRSALKKAREICENLARENEAILVRRISLKTPVCRQWLIKRG